MRVALDGLVLIAGRQRLLNPALVSSVSVRFKGVQAPHRTSWKPKPAKWERDHYFRPQERVLTWRESLLQQQQKMKEKQQTSDQQITPSPLHMVSRVKTLRHEPHFHKDMCEEFGIKETMHKPVIVPNTSANNEKLLTIKHLIRVKPVVMRDKSKSLDQLTEDDLRYTQLRSDGSLDVVQKLDVAETESTPKRRLQGETLKHHLRQKVNNHQILEEYYKSKPEWKYGEDGSTDCLYKPRGGV